MKKIGIVTYNKYCNFTNYGSALQTWALYNVICHLKRYDVVLVDYCPDTMIGKNPLNPLSNMRDRDSEILEQCRKMLPVIKENYIKFEQFYSSKFRWTNHRYTKENMENIVDQEEIDGFVCGSDTIFCPDEFGIDDGYYANYKCMQKKAVAYAASFGDPHFSDEMYDELKQKLNNFNCIGLREQGMMSFVNKNTTIMVENVIDPTLLLREDEYSSITAPRLEEGKYLLLYSRRYNADMEKYAETLAEENDWKIVEISLRAENEKKRNHRMYYEAGVEEFLSLVKYAEFIVTNSFHGMIFSIQFQKQFMVFSREQGEAKICEVLKKLNLEERLQKKEAVVCKEKINYMIVMSKIEQLRNKSLKFLQMELDDYL